MAAPTFSRIHPPRFLLWAVDTRRRCEEDCPAFFQMVCLLVTVATTADMGREADVPCFQRSQTVITAGREGPNVPRPSRAFAPANRRICRSSGNELIAAVADIGTGILAA